MIPTCSVEGKVAVITGSSQGIGNRLARGFAEAGASVGLVARRASPLEVLANEIQAQGGKVLAVPTDITVEDQVSRMVEKTMEKFGRIDVLINCAGGSGADRFIPMLEMEPEVWDRVVNLNLRGTYLCCRAVGRVMTKQQSGSMINFSSGAAMVPVPGMAHYCSAKIGINQLTKVLAVEWGAYNVRVNAISPGLTDTAGEREHMPPELWKQYAKQVPLGRVGQPEDILGTALFLASDASAFVTGVIVPVSGGPQ